MGANQQDQPLGPGELVDLGFLDARSKLLDVAAFLDRLDRVGGTSDFRVEALRQSLAEIASADSGRARRILELLSDRSAELAPTAHTQSACGAPPPAKKA